MSNWKRAGRWCGYTLGGIALTLMLAVGGFCLWLWGWTWKSTPDFHESWTQEERSALTAFDRLLKDQMDDYVPMIIEQSRRESFITAPLTIWECIDYACAIRDFFAGITNQLQQAIESGHAGGEEQVDFRNPFGCAVRGYTPAIVAAQHAQLDAMKALVQHGANPNTIAMQIDGDADNTEAETPLAPLLNGNFITGEKIPWNTRRQFAEWLLAQGADINGTRRIVGLACDLPLVCGFEEGAAPWQWALDHGKTVTVENLCNIAAGRDSTALLERILQDKLVDINDASSTKTVLQVLMNQLAASDEEDFAELMRLDIERKLDMLLAAGADPNLVLLAAQPQQPGESDEAYEQRRGNTHADTGYPLDIATRWLEYAGYPPMQEYCQRIIARLRAAGARSRQAE